MKVLLVSVNNEREPYPVAPLGAAYVAAAATGGGHEVRFLDLLFAADDGAALRTALGEFSPQVVALSLRNIDNLTFGKSVFYMPRIREVVERIRELTGAPLVVGGSGFSIFPEEVLRYLGVEFGVQGEGEEAFAGLLRAFESGGPFDAIPNLCVLKDGSFSAAPIAYAAQGTKPDRTLLDNGAYYEQGGMANVQSKRGCPFKCTYCTYPQVEGSSLRLRKPAEIVAELKEARDRDGIGYFFFVDDIFNCPAEHAAALCEEMALSGLGIRWACFATPYGMTRELALLMKRAGCAGVEFGSDSGAEKTLQALGKHFTAADIAHAAECCRSVDLPNAHYIIMGGPDEDAATLRETFTLYERIRPTALIALVGIRIYPRTGVRQRAVAEGIIRQEQSLLDPVFYLTPLVETEELMRQVAGFAERQTNVVVPCLTLRYDSGMMAMLRKTGRKGPLWDMLS